jgi:hypothetical protein
VPQVVYKVPFQRLLLTTFCLSVPKPNPPQLSQNVYCLCPGNPSFPRYQIFQHIVEVGEFEFWPALGILTHCMGTTQSVSCYRPRLPRPLDMIILIIPVSTANHKSLHPAGLPYLLSPPVQTPFSAGYSQTPSIRNLVDHVLHPHRTKVNIAILMATINVLLNVRTAHRPNYVLRINLKGKPDTVLQERKGKWWQFVRRNHRAGWILIWTQLQTRAVCCCSARQPACSSCSCSDSRCCETGLRGVLSVFCSVPCISLSTEFDVAQMLQWTIFIFQHNRR